MLGLRDLDGTVAEAIRAEDGFPPDWTDFDELETVADDRIAAFRRRRREAARDRGPTWGLRDAVDRVVRTDRDEYIDRPDVDEEKKLEAVRELHRMNQVLGSYEVFADVLSYVADGVREREDRDDDGGEGRDCGVAVLELASGYGEFALELERTGRADEDGIAVTGSDVVPRYVAEANERAEREGLATRFVELDALALGPTAIASAAADTPGATGDPDVVFVAQSVHHFSPGQLARMVAGAGEVADAFVAIDGRRTARVLGFLGPMAAVASRDPLLTHDAVVSSRRLYAEAELEVLATVAAPDATITTGARPPGFTVLDVRFDG